MRHFLLILVAISLTGGCELAMAELGASYRVSVDGAQLYVNGYFYDVVRGDDFVDLGDDRVIATFRGREYTITPGEFGFDTPIDLEAPLIPDEPVSITLVREGQPDARSTILVPPLMEVVPVPLFVKRSEPLTLTWSPITNDTMVWYLEGHCVDGRGDIAPGTRTVTIPADAHDDDFLKGTCTANLTLRRTRIGPVDPTFAEGRIYFLDEYTAQFASTP